MSGLRATMAAMVEDEDLARLSAAMQRLGVASFRAAPDPAAGGALRLAGVDPEAGYGTAFWATDGGPQNRAAALQAALDGARLRPPLNLLGAVATALRRAGVGADAIPEGGQVELRVDPGLVQGMPDRLLVSAGKVGHGGRFHGDLRAEIAVDDAPLPASLRAPAWTAMAWPTGAWGGETAAGENDAGDPAPPAPSR